MKKNQIHIESKWDDLQISLDLFSSNHFTDPSEQHKWDEIILSRIILHLCIGSSVHFGDQIDAWA